MSKASPSKRAGALDPRLRWTLLAALAVSAYAASQPEEAGEDDLLASRGASASRATTQMPSNEARRHRASAAGYANAGARDTAGSGAITAGETQRFAALVAAWQARVAEQHSGVASADATPAAAPRAWASQTPPAPPPPPPVADVQPAEESSPVAPQFPYEWVGRYVDDAPHAVIAGPVGTWVVKQGEVLEGTWRVDQIKENQLRVTYLPMNQSQTLAMK